MERKTIVWILQAIRNDLNMTKKGKPEKRS